MTIRHGLLALLGEQDMYGTQLRSEFEQRTGGTWPLNIGQVYQTLSRLERDGLVEADPADAEGRIAYRVTTGGHDEVSQWFASAVRRDSDPRDELSIKLALAVTMSGVDVAAVVQTQRAATLEQLQDYTRLKRGAGAERDLAWELVLERLVFNAEAQVRWLDHVEARVRRAAAQEQVVADAAVDVPEASDVRS